jgi:5-methyltetrahydrofolate--homocysteine methyltransferase
MKDIRERLQRGDVIVGDGAWGTLLMEHGLKPGEPTEVWNLSHQEFLEEIAGRYVHAGSEIITTNTFGASPLKLQLHSLDGRSEEINRAAVDAARRGAAGKAYISGSVGPTGRFLIPYGDTEPEQISSSFECQIQALVGAGVDLICVETMTDLAEATLAVKAARRLKPAIPVMATMTFEKGARGFFTMMGVSVEAAAEGLEAAGADVVGSNCGNGIEAMIGIAREFKRHSHLPIAIQSNAGLPVIRNGVTIYPETPDYMASKATELLALGVQIIGGCCGTGPEHIQALRRVVDAHLAKPFF